MSLTFEPADEAWLKFLSRWAVALALVYLALLAAFAVLLGSAGSAPLESAELVAASRDPGFHRLTALLDALVWIGLGGTLLASAGLFARRAPVRAAFLAACGVGQVAGLIGACLRLSATGAFAARYVAASADQQPAVVQSYVSLFQVISAHYNAGGLLYGVGFLLIGWMSLSLGGFPRWLAAWFAVSGAYAVANQGVVVAAGTFLPLPLFVLHAWVGGDRAPYWPRCGVLARTKGAEAPSGRLGCKLSPKPERENTSWLRPRCFV
jgi:hypothetical protein